MQVSTLRHTFKITRKSILQASELIMDPEQKEDCIEVVCKKYAILAMRRGTGFDLRFRANEHRS